MDKCFIPYNTPSSKNSRANSSRGSFHSATVRKYLQKLGIKKFSSSKRTVEGYVDPNRPNLFKQEVSKLSIPEHRPVIMGFHPVRDSKRAFDLHNVVQIIADLLQAHGVIEDDDSENLVMVPIPIKKRYYTVDKDNPGMWLIILNS